MRFLEEREGTPAEQADQTDMLRWYTELETQVESDATPFEIRHANILRGIKFVPLSFITTREERIIFDLGRMKMERLEDIGLIVDAETQSIKNSIEYTETRGKDGFFQKELSTQRAVQEWKEKTVSSKVKRAFGFFKGKQKQPEQEQQTEAVQ